MQALRARAGPRASTSSVTGCVLDPDAEWRIYVGAEIVLPVAVHAFVLRARWPESGLHFADGVAELQLGHGRPICEHEDDSAVDVDADSFRSALEVAVDALLDSAYGGARVEPPIATLPLKCFSWLSESLGLSKIFQDAYCMPRAILRQQLWHDIGNSLNMTGYDVEVHVDTRDSSSPAPTMESSEGSPTLRIFRCHKALLASRSSHLALMLDGSSPWKEASEGVLHLSAPLGGVVTGASLCATLAFIYTDTLVGAMAELTKFRELNPDKGEAVENAAIAQMTPEEQTAQDLVSLLETGEFMGCSGLVEHCENALEGLITDVETAFAVWEYTLTHSTPLAELAECCRELVIDNFLEAQHTTAFLQATPHMLAEIFGPGKIDMTAHDILEAISRWEEYQLEHNTVGLSSVQLAQVVTDLLPPHTMLNRANRDRLLTGRPTFRQWIMR